MKEIKTAEVNGLLFQANFEEGNLTSLEVSLSSSRTELSLIDVSSIVTWLRVTILDTPLEDVVKPTVTQTQLDKVKDELAQRSVSKTQTPRVPNMSGVQIHDFSAAAGNIVKWKDTKTPGAVE